MRCGAGRYARPVSRISIVGVPSSAASYAAGQDLAPAALRSAGLPAKLIAAGLEVRDEGDLPVQVWKPDREHPLAQNAGPATESLRQLTGRLGPVLARGDFALVLGGNCTIALGVVAALRRLEAGAPGLLWPPIQPAPPQLRLTASRLARSRSTSTSMSWTSPMPRWRKIPAAVIPGPPSAKPNRPSRWRCEIHGQERCRSASSTRLAAPATPMRFPALPTASPGYSPSQAADNLHTGRRPDLPNLRT